MTLSYKSEKIHGAGLGLRRAFLREFAAHPATHADFFEVAPENWIHVQGKLRDLFEQAAAHMPMVCHGLSLNLGGQAPLDLTLVREIQQFLSRYNVAYYSEHLSYCGDEGHLYDLLPIPFTAQAITHVSDRIKQVQDVLGQQMAVENVSYYCAPGQQMPEIEFLLSVLDAADCLLLLDVNNVYVNSINHVYDPIEFLQQLPSERIAYGHIAGHCTEHETLLVDTHGSAVIDPVWRLLGSAYSLHGVFPTLLERDFNIPSLADLELELQQIIQIQQLALSDQAIQTATGTSL
jgi:uncharacterized protein (UPF0276 family)